MLWLTGIVKMTQGETTAIYKVLRAEEWQRFELATVFTGSEIDLRDGFIHLSYSDQVEETAVRHFFGEAGLVLLALDSKRCAAALRAEVSRGGALFPHLYRALGLDDIVWARPIALDPAGAPILPALGSADPGTPA